MSKRAFDKIATGLRHAIADAKGEPGHVTKVTEIEPIDVKAVREATGLGQRDFAATFLLSYDTLVKWEQGTRSPTGAARLLLHVIKENPKAVLKVAKKVGLEASH